jgi:hypothetical protein
MARNCVPDAARWHAKVIGTAFAGKAWQGAVGPGECVKIMTGAIMPTGLDTVVPQEFTTVAGDRVTIPAELLQRGDNRRTLGEDLMAGRAALSQGTRLSPAACGLLASLGIATVPVFRRLKVAYFSTGDEILSLGEPPREGAVYDSNRYTVFGLLTRLGVRGDRPGRGARRARAAGGGLHPGSAAGRRHHHQRRRERGRGGLHQDHDEAAGWATSRSGALPCARAVRWPWDAFQATNWHQPSVKWSQTAIKR